MVKSSIALLCKCTSNLKKRRIDETPEQYLKQITHLYLNEKHLEEIGSEISLCKNLTVLYLYGNILKEIPDLSSVIQLTHLYLQNNNIERIDNLSSLVRLEKLFLSRNSISVIEGLEGLYSLQELRVDHQRLQPEECLLFDDQSLLSVNKTLSRLDISGNRIESLQDLCILSELTYLSTSNNNLRSLTELTETLTRWPKLKELEISGNPILQTPRAKEAIIVNSASLEILDGKPISHLTRKFLENWHHCKGTLIEKCDDRIELKSLTNAGSSSETTNSLIRALSRPSNESVPLKLVDDFDLAQGETVQIDEKRYDELKEESDKPQRDGEEEKILGCDSKPVSESSAATCDGPMERGESRSKS